MNSLCKKITTTLLGIIMCVSLVFPMQVTANEVKHTKLTYNELITIADPYIKKVGVYFKITNENELHSILGEEYYDMVVTRVKEANIELAKTYSKDAVTDIHVKVLRKAGATVEYHWWGKRILTNSRTVAINVRNLANGFSGEAGKDGVVEALTLAGISLIPGLGTAATIAGAIVSVASWANSATWSEVKQKVAEKIDVGIYNLTIDINGWVMDVRVY